MGLTHVTVTTKNPADNSLFWESLFLVDTGAIDSLVPAKYLIEIGLTPQTRRNYELANGQEIVMDVAGARFEFMGEVVWCSVIFGPDDAEPILGVTALESVGIAVDPKTQSLKRLPAVSLK